MDELMVTRVAWSQGWLTRVLLLALVALATFLAACGPTSVSSCQGGLTVDAAQLIARDLALSGQPSDMTVVEISSGLSRDQMHADTAWTVQVDVVGRFPQANQPGGKVDVPMHWLIDVDKCTGAARVIGQG